jgi:hypothetical protein
VKSISPTQHVEGVPEEQRRAIIIDHEEAVADQNMVVDLDYFSQELVHNPEDPYGILEGCRIIVDKRGADENEDPEVVIVVDEPPGRTVN